MRLLFLLFCVTTVWAFPNSKATRPDVKIIGGSVARRGQFPFAAAIYTSTADGNYFCGGTLLNAQWVLTAGQCVIGVHTFNIHLGATALKGDDPYAVQVSSDTYVLHPDYDPQTLANDVGLIWLRLPVAFSDYLKPIDYLPSSELGESSSAMTLGWGQISDEEEGTVNDLRWVNVTSLSNAECKITYGNQILDSMVCVDGSYNEGTCKGDSGGPLVQLISRGRYVVVGVSSFVSWNGCESTDPSGFTRIFPYNEWIKNVTGKA
ncbi:brachyurin isoform X1 [Tribolium castaneum]|uniref:Serine protease H106 n=1 Tax=Tribolium castaneum TaxID=7070 RepID=D6WN55_TRICA|nr:serine protease H106 [Tribolium castaneum]